MLHDASVRLRRQTRIAALDNGTRARHHPHHTAHIRHHTHHTQPKTHSLAPALTSPHPPTPRSPSPSSPPSTTTWAASPPTIRARCGGRPSRRELHRVFPPSLYTTLLSLLAACIMRQTVSPPDHTQTQTQPAPPNPTPPNPKGPGPQARRPRRRRPRPLCRRRGRLRVGPRRQPAGRQQPAGHCGLRACLRQQDR